MGIKENSPIIIKDRYEVTESDVGFCIPIVDKDDCIVNWRECTYEEYKAWTNRHERK